jgi:hypothetical protein
MKISRNKTKGCLIMLLVTLVNLDTSQKTYTHMNEDIIPQIVKYRIPE